MDQIQTFSEFNSNLFRKFICFSAECRIARPFIPMDLLSGTPTYFIYAQKERELLFRRKQLFHRNGAGLFDSA